MELVEQSAVSSANDLKLYSNQRDFYVEDENGKHFVEKHNINPLLRDVSQHKVLNEFVGNGYIRINKFEEGKYALVAKVRGNGGGWITGKIAGWTVRAVGYGGYAVAAIFHPEVLAEAHLVHEAIEASALTVEVAGTLLPTP